MTATSLFKPRTDKHDISIISELLYQLKVRDVMTQNVYTVTAQHTLRDVQHIMREKKVSGVPVVEGAQLVGIVSLDDIIRALDAGEIETVVENKMSRNVYTTEEHVSVVKAIDEMESSGFGRLPVVDASHRLVGIMTHWDVVRKLIVLLQDVALKAEERERTLHEETEKEDTSTPEEQDVIHLEFKVDKDDFENAGLASSSVKKHLQKRGVAPAVIRRVAVAMYEAEINIIIHSLGGRFTVDIRPGRVDILAEDKGPGIEDVEKAMTEGFSTASAKVREMGFGAGMGLPNIKRCADAFTIDSQPGGHTRISFSVDIK